MLLKERNRANTKCSVDGPGGRHCACCADAPKFNKKNRRAMRRIEKQEWKKESE